MNLVLDMDGTLIGPTGEPRPFLDRFLLFCFANFQTVSIWTAASEAWFGNVNDEVFQPLLAIISQHLQRQCQFRFVYTYNHCVHRRDDSGCFPIIVKPLHKIWNAKTLYPEFTADNTLVVDDTRHTFAQNYGNALDIPLYVDGPDIHLLSLMQYLEHLEGVFMTFGTIRTIEKRGWYNHPARIARSEELASTYIPLAVPMDLSED